MPWRHGPWSGAVEDGWLYGRGSVDMKGAVGGRAARAGRAGARGGAGRGRARRGRLRGGRRPRRLRRARARRALRRVPDPRADGLRRRLRAGRRGDLRGRGPRRRRARRPSPGGRLGHRPLPARPPGAGRARAGAQRRRRAPAHARARAALPAARRAPRGGGVVEQRARPAALRGPRAGARGGGRRRGARGGRGRGGARLPRGDAVVARRAVRLGRDRPGAPVRGARARALGAELGREVAFAGVPWGADMRLWTARGIPTVMAGTPGIERAHAVDERVRVDDLVTLARAIVRRGAPPSRDGLDRGCGRPPHRAAGRSRAVSPRRARGPGGGRRPAPPPSGRWP